MEGLLQITLLLLLSTIPSSVGKPAQLESTRQSRNAAPLAAEDSNQDQGMLLEQHVEEFSTRHFPKHIPGHKQYLAPSTLLIKEHQNTDPYEALIILVPTVSDAAQTPHDTNGNKTTDVIDLFSRIRYQFRRHVNNLDTP